MFAETTARVEERADRVSLRAVAPAGNESFRLAVLGVALVVVYNNTTTCLTMLRAALTVALKMLQKIMPASGM